MLATALLLPGPRRRRGQSPRVLCGPSKVRRQPLESRDTRDCPKRGGRGQEGTRSPDPLVGAVRVRSIVRRANGAASSASTPISFGTRALACGWSGVVVSPLFKRSLDTQPSRRPSDTAGCPTTWWCGSLRALLRGVGKRVGKVGGAQHSINPANRLCRNERRDGRVAEGGGLENR